jgi:hypothetical protein
MKSITTTALLLLISIGAIQCINWSNITATELSELSNSAFSSISADELGSIPDQVKIKLGYNILFRSRRI